MRFFLRAAVVVFMGPVPALAAEPAQEPGAAQPAAERRSDSITGFTRASSQAQRGVEERLASFLDPNRVDKDFRELTREPHVAGLERNNALAAYVADSFRAAGLEEVTESTYDVLMSYPKEIVVEMVEPTAHQARLAEDPYEADPDSAHSRLGLPYHAYSASGEASALVVYARNGNPEDYEHLKAQSIDVRGKIALLRYSVPYSYRGFKAYTAEKLGVAGLLIYSDPKDDGFVKGRVFPEGPWGPLGHIQRGAITYDFLVPGDPLTPGWPSLTGARRIPESEAASLPKIMSSPLSARDAQVILGALGGPEAPEEWRGALDVPYRLGPGPARVRMKLDIPRPLTRIVNVTGLVKGREEPERIVLLGNHRDAWVFGGVDPSSGTATMLELARALGQLAKDGWRPRRSIMLASWDAEEFALTGSTEWGEQHLAMLRDHLVAYLNVDSSTSGSSFSASASASLAALVEETLADVTDPNSGASLLQVWKEGARGGGATALASGAGQVGDIGSGSDHTVFLNLVGAPAVDMTFEGDYGVYHSAYDDYFWMTRFGDPGLRYMTRMAELWGRMATRLASADVLPLDYEAYGRKIDSYLAALGEVVELREARAGAVSLAEAGSPIRAVQVDPARIALLSLAERARLNAKLIEAERALCDKRGLPDRPWFKHLIYACRYTYAALVLPGLTEAVERQDKEEAARRARVLIEALKRSAKILMAP